MTRKKPHWRLSKTPVPGWAICDACGRRQADVDSRRAFWNPNPRAHIRNICAACFEERSAATVARWRRRQEELAGLDRIGFAPMPL